MLTGKQYTLSVERHKKAIGDALFLVLVGLVLACAHHAWRGTAPLFVLPPNPAYQGLKNTTFSEVQQLRQQKDVVFLDARPEAAYQRERIPGSLSVPLHSNLTAELLARLGEARLVVIYCDSPKCDASKQLALRLRAEGIEGLRVFEGGLESWKAQGLAVEGEAAQ